MIHRFLDKFSVFELILIALMGCLGIATKPLITPIAHMITGPLYIPGGAVAGGFYMLWLVMAVVLVKKPGAATLAAVVQALMVMALGIFGTHGLMSIFTYLLPGLAIDLVLLVSRHRGCCVGCCFASGIAANISGTLLVNLVFFRLPLIPLLLVIFSAALSGGLGGIIAHTVGKQFRKQGLGVLQEQ